jgi:hypothetical protein
VTRSYLISDEPTPGTISRVSVNPFWPLMCVMFAGAGVSWVWFVLNGFAIGSPTRRRELIVAVGGGIGSALLMATIGSFYAGGAVGDTAIPYLMLIVVVWKLGISYGLYMLQADSFAIYEYYGGTVQNGWPGLIIGLVGWNLARASALSNFPLLIGVLS